MRNVLLSVLIMSAASAAPSLAQQPERQPDRVINVNAVGTVQREPEKAVITVAVESQSPNAQTAAAANARKMDAVFAALRRMGIVPPKVRTIAYELQPQYAQPDRNNPNPEPKIVGYRAINMVLIDVDTVARAGAVIDGVIAAGANRVTNLSFELRDPESARLEALKIAVGRARAEAEVLATAAGQRLGVPTNISSSSHFQPVRYQMRDQAEMAMAAAPPTPIEAGMLTITANVNIVYKMEDR
jgi:uncharacterized protein YggE